MIDEDDVTKEEYLKSLNIDQINLSLLRKSIKSIEPFPFLCI